MKVLCVLFGFSSNQSNPINLERKEEDEIYMFQWVNSLISLFQVRKCFKDSVYTRCITQKIAPKIIYLFVAKPCTTCHMHISLKSFSSIILNLWDTAVCVRARLIPSRFQNAFFHCTKLTRNFRKLSQTVLYSKCVPDVDEWINPGIILLQSLNSIDLLKKNFRFIWKISRIN